MIYYLSITDHNTALRVCESRGRPPALFSRPTVCWFQPHPWDSRYHRRHEPGCRRSDASTPSGFLYCAYCLATPLL
ncbi:hypothetical protein BDW72DRAFT_166311 [Aspergillus terricola var. indicus]